MSCATRFKGAIYIHISLALSAPTGAFSQDLVVPDPSMDATEQLEVDRHERLLTRIEGESLRYEGFHHGRL